MFTSLFNPEKQFGIRSQEAAWIFSGNEISQIFFILVLPFLPRIKKRTLWTSIAMIFSALGQYDDILSSLGQYDRSDLLSSRSV